MAWRDTGLQVYCLNRRVKTEFDIFLNDKTQEKPVDSFLTSSTQGVSDVITGRISGDIKIFQ